MRLLSLLFLFSIAALAGPKETDRQFIDGPGNRNLLLNPGFENGFQDWNLVSPASTRFLLDASTAVAVGNRSMVFDSGGENEHIESDLYTIPRSLFGNPGLAKISYEWSTGVADEMQMIVLDHAASTVASLNLKPTTKWTDAFLNFTCPSAGSMKLRIASANDVQDQPSMNLDNMWLGKDYSTLPVTNTFAYWTGYHEGNGAGTGAGGCSWSFSNAIADPSGDADCNLTEVLNSGFGTVTSRDSAGSELPGLTIVPSQTGVYSVCVAQTDGSDSGGPIVWRLQDITEGVTLWRSGNIIDDKEYCALVSLTATVTKTISIQAATGGNSARIIDVTASSYVSPAIYWTIFKVD